MRTGTGFMRCRLTITAVALGLFCACGPSRASDPPPAFAEPPNAIDLRALYSLDAASESLLRHNGFVVLDQFHQRSLHNTYPDHGGGGGHLLVTTDAMLALWFDLHRDLLKAAERDALLPRLQEIVPHLQHRADALQALAKGQQNEEAALHQVAVTLAVAEQLLHEETMPVATPATLRRETDELVRKVMAHSEVSEYPGEDFTQYTVRGHYTDSPELARYFRASLWLTRRFFAVTPSAHSPADDPDDALRGAIAFAAVVRDAAPDIAAKLTACNALRQSLGGPPDAVSVTQMGNAITQTLGAKWTLARALQPDALAKLRTELAKPAYAVSQITTRVTFPDTPFPKQVVSLLPGIAIPDSVLFHHTVNPSIPKRSVPTGLEVAAALGFGVARQQIALTEKDNAAAILAAVDRYGKPIGQDDGTTVYSGWLNALATLKEVPAHAPAYMQNESWQFEKVNTALAGWAQLRHSYLLYGEQETAMMMGETRAAPSLVEPNPAFFHAMRLLSTRARRVLSAADALDAGVSKRLVVYERKCQDFETYAQAELAGTLSDKQAEDIDGFGKWLQQFPPSLAAQVADVATGMNGEVLHAATGDFKTLLVIPDPKTGVVYSGAVMSYYEFTRNAHDRLTDARWQAEQSDTYRRPLRPAWTSAFIAQQGGPEWEAHAPLRQAEQLLADNKTEAGVALLRQTAAAHPDTTLATEAQYRLGKYFFDEKQWTSAETELRACENLPGCDAFDDARDLLRRIASEKEQQDTIQRIVTPRKQKADADFARMRADIAAVKTARNRASAEKQLAMRLLRDLPWDTISGENRTEAARLLQEAAHVCQTPACRDALGYAALIASENYAKQAARTMSLMAYFHTATSPALKAGALGMALTNEYERQGDTPTLPQIKPLDAFALLHPFFNDAVFADKNDVALRLLKSASTTQRQAFLLDPHYEFIGGMKLVRNALLNRSLYAGNIREAFKYAQMFPVDHFSAVGGSDIRFGEFTGIWYALGKKEAPALSLLAIAEGLEAGKHPDAARQQYLVLTERCPHSILTPFVLGDLAAEYVEEGNVLRAASFRKRLLADYPTSYPALSVQVQAAYDRGDVARTRALLTARKAAASRVPEEVRDHFTSASEFSNNGIEGELQYLDGKRKALKSLLDAAPQCATPALLNPSVDTETRSFLPLQSAENGMALANALVKALPDREGEIYLAVGKEYQSGKLMMRFLERFPNDARAGQAWTQLVGDPNGRTQGTFALPFPDNVRWLAPFVNRGPGYPYRDAADTLFKRGFENYGGRYGLRLLEDKVRQVQTLFPDTRMAQMSDVLVAQALLANSRPEAMLPYADRVLVTLPGEDPARQELVLLRKRAESEIAVKHQPAWKPVWTATLRPTNFDDPSEAPNPMVTAGLLLATEPDEKGKRQVVALDAATGAPRWKTALSGSVVHLTMPAERRGYATLDSGVVAAFDLANGKTLWAKAFGKSDEGYPIDGAVLAGKTLIVYGGDVGIAGISPDNGAVLWKQLAWKLTRIGRSLYGEPAVVGTAGNEIVLVACDETLRAFAPAEGVSLWEGTYPRPALPQAAAAANPNRPRRQRPSLWGQPLLMDSTHVLINIQSPSRRLELVNARTGAVEQTGEPTQFPSGPNMLFVGSDFVVEWDFNGMSAVRRLPDFAKMPARVLVGHARPPLTTNGHTLYFCNQQDAQLWAISVETGAIFARGATPAANYNSMTTRDEKQVYVVSLNGQIAAFPLQTLP